MWGEMLIPMYRLWLHGLYGLYGPRWPLSPKTPINLISLSPPTHLVCNDHLIPNFLSFHMSLVVVMNCGAGNELHGFEISMFYFFFKLYSIHISKYILLLWEQYATKQCKWYIPGSRYVKDCENVKLVNRHYARPHKCLLYHACFLKRTILG